MSRGQYTIGELVERAGVPATTIHHYRRAGLLPPPAPGGANRFLYDDRHVQALRLVRLLRERRHLSLETIREVLPELLAVDEEAFRPAMWDQVVASHEGGRARAAILDAARHAFAAHGYAEVNVADVAEAVGVGKGTVYRHFASKEDLFAAAAVSAIAGVTVGFRAGVAALGPELGPESGRLDEVAAERLLAAALAPELGLLLEFVNRAVRHEPGRAADVRRRFGDLAATVGEALGGAGAGEPDRGEPVVQAAIARAVLAALGAPDDG